MTKMTDAFKKVFLGLGGNPQELAENNDVGDYILDLEGAIKEYVDKSAPDVDKTIVIDVDQALENVLSIHLMNSEVDIVSAEDISDYIKQGYNFVLHTYPVSEGDSTFYTCSSTYDSPIDDEELCIYFSFNSIKEFCAVTISYRDIDNSRSVRLIPFYVYVDELYINGSFTIDNGNVTDLLLKRGYEVVVDGEAETTDLSALSHYPLQRIAITYNNVQYEGNGYCFYNGSTGSKILVSGINTTTNELFKCSITVTYNSGKYTWALDYFTTYNLPTT